MQLKKSKDTLPSATAILHSNAHAVRKFAVPNLIPHAVSALVRAGTILKNILINISLTLVESCRILHFI